MLFDIRYVKSYCTRKCVQGFLMCDMKQQILIRNNLYLREEDIVGCQCNLTIISTESGTSEPSSNPGLACYAHFHFNVLGKCMNRLLLLK